MAKMSHNVYYKIRGKEWLNTTLEQVTDVSVLNDTVKAYLYKDNTNAVIAFKGTSVYWISDQYDLEKQSERIQTERIQSQQKQKLLQTDMDLVCPLSSSAHDKFNDNLFFSCCFYKQSNLFNKCDECKGDNLQSECCKNCYKTSLGYVDNYINLVKDIVENVRKTVDFDNTNVYFTGHSLGGMLASVASVIYDKPAVTFESPGDLHYLILSGIGISDKVYHFGHNGDPLFVGNCGVTCSIVGYYIDTKCHSGFTCSYDAKGKLGYTESILNHRIEYIIKHVIPNWEKDFPECIVDSNCIDCENWNYN
jgi:putative lipase involved disintegration of autophagic bodies